MANVIFKTSTDKTIDNLFIWTKSNGIIEPNYNQDTGVPFSEGTVYFTSDGHIVFDTQVKNNNTLENKRIWMSKEAYSAIYAKDIDETHADIANIIKYSPRYVSASGVAAVTSSPYTHSKWNITDNTITSLYDGLTITFKVPVAGHGTYGTGISINGGDYHPVVYNVNSMISTRYGVNSTITLTYNTTQTGTLYKNSASSTSVTGVWQLEDYDSTNIYQLRTNYARKLGPSTGDSTSTKSLYRYQFLIEDKNGLLIPFGFRNNQATTYTKPLTTAPFNPFSPIYYYNYTTTVAVNDNIPAGYLYEQYLADMRYSFNIKSDGTVGTQALTANAPIYIKALYDHTTGTATFAPNTSSSNYLEKSSLTQTLPIANPNSSLTNNNTEYIYIQLGNAYDKYRVDLNAFNKVIYHWDSSANTCLLFSPITVVNNTTNLVRNTETTIATINNTPIKIKLPASDNTNTTYTFTNGTNGFTVTPSGGSAQTVTVTPSITNNITGSGTRTSGYLAKFSGENTITNGPQIGTDATKFLNNKGEWAVPTGTYSLPLAADGVKGGIQIGYNESGNNYAVKLSNEKAYVTVPWTDYKVRQINDTSNTNYRILLSNSANNTQEDNITHKNDNLQYNPSTNKLSTGNIHLTGELNVVGDAYLHNQTTIESATISSLIVTGNTSFSQSPTAPTPADSSNDTTLATTAFVKSRIAASNSNTATDFASAKTIALTGDVSGSASGGNNGTGWSITTSIGAGKVTNNMLAGNITNNKLSNSSITIAGTSVDLGSSINADTLRTNLGLSNALHFIGITTTPIEDGDTGKNEYAGITISNYVGNEQNGDVIIYGNQEFVWTGSLWEILGPDGSYKVLQSAVDSGTTTTNKWVSRIQQNINGEITVTLSDLNTSGTWSGNAVTATRANITTTTNSIAYYSDTAGTFASKSSANGVLYATSTDGSLQWGILPIAQGGTGATSASAARTNLGLGSLATKSSLAWNEITQSGANSISQGNSDVTDNTEIFTSYASDNGFSDSLGLGKVYRRAAIKLYNYIKTKAGTSGSNFNIAGNATTATNLSGTKTANTIYAGPTSGNNAAPTFRALVAADIPDLNYIKTNDISTTSSSHFNLNTSYNAGLYSVTGGYIDNYPILNAGGTEVNAGAQFGTLLTLPYRKAYGNSNPDYGFQLFNRAGFNRLLFRTGISNNASSWSSWRELVHIAANTETGSTNIPVYVNDIGEVKAITTLSTNCYTNSRDPGYGKIKAGTASTSTSAITSNTSTIEASTYNETLTINPGNKWIVVAATNSNTTGSDTFTIGHVVPNSITNSGPSSAQTPSFNSTFNIPTISLDEAGHITGIGTTTVKIPAQTQLSGGTAAAADAKVVGGVTVSDHTITIAQKTITAGTGISVTGATDKVTINHSNSITAKTAAAQSAKTLTWGGTFTIYEEKYDAQGHITGVASYNMTMPSNPNVDKKVTQSASTTANWRKILLHYKEDTTSTAAITNTTNQVYAAVGVSVQPSTGAIRAKKYNIADHVSLEYDSTLETLNFVFS